MGSVTIVEPERMPLAKAMKKPVPFLYLRAMGQSCPVRIQATKYDGFYHLAKTPWKKGTLLR